MGEYETVVCRGRGGNVRGGCGILTYHKYTVDAVYDGEEALSYAHAEQYDGIILDVMMPKKERTSGVKRIKGGGM